MLGKVGMIFVILRVGDEHAVLGYSRALVHVRAQLDGFRSRLAAQVPELVVAGAADVNVLEFLRADEDVVTVGQMHHAQERGAGNIAGEAANDARLQVNFERVSEAFVHESDVLVVWREVGALTEVSKYLDVRGQRIDGAALLSLGVQKAR